jgi:hypothetical protein
MTTARPSKPGARGAILALGLVACGLGVILIGSPALAVEEPKFTLVLREGSFEIRDYQPAVAAEVTVTGGQREAAGKGFRLLAGYIFGGNRRRQSIAMTAPVAQQPAGRTIAMTAPVTQSRRDGEWVVRFTMPAAYTLATLPEPDDPRVQLRALPPERFAVERFSGLADPQLVEAKTAELEGFVRAHGLRAIGPVSLAQYDPPWTLWFMRRNEVMIPVAR